MIAELVHTSLQRGLDGGTGFVVAGRTGGMPRALAESLSALSGLAEAWPGAGDDDRTLRATRAIVWQGDTAWVASVIRPCGVDHTGRGNRLAHHRLLDAGEIDSVDPASLLLDGAWREAWAGEPRELDAPMPLKALVGHVGACMAWARTFGDAGVAAAALERAFRSGVGAWVVVPAGTDRGALLRELVGLLPQANRWKRGWATRPLHPAAGEAPVICVVDAREPEVARAPSGAAWVIDAATLAPVAAEAMVRRARDGGAHDDAPARRATIGAGRVTVAPPTRLAAPPGDVPEEHVAPGGDARIASVEAGAPDEPGASAIHVRLVAPRRAVAWPWLVAAGLALAAIAWWFLHGGSA